MKDVFLHHRLTRSIKDGEGIPAGRFVFQEFPVACCKCLPVEAWPFLEWLAQNASVIGVVRVSGRV